MNKLYLSVNRLPSDLLDKSKYLVRLTKGAFASTEEMRKQLKDELIHLIRETDIEHVVRISNNAWHIYTKGAV